MVNYDNEFDKLSNSSTVVVKKGYQSSSSEACPYWATSSFFISPSEVAWAGFMADTVQACFSMISASLFCFSAAFCSEINNYIISMGFGGPNHWRCFGKTTLVARHEGRQLYLPANSDQDKTLWFLYPSPAHTTNHSILSGLLISLHISNTIVLPLFNYCSPLWDSCGVGGKAYLDIKVK